ncbi:MAG: ATP-dependent zinc metalloprotease FtsH [Candidatus Krumholzibacteriota bacterium]
MDINEEFKPGKNYLKKSKMGMLPWLILIIAIAIYFYFFPAGRNRTEISYSKFKQQVEKGNVSGITIKGSRIKGKFEKPYKPETGQEEAGGYRFFKTVKPRIEDTGLIGMLEKNGVEIEAEVEQRPWFLNVIIYALPFLLIVGYFVYMSRRMAGKGRGSPGGVFGIGKSRAKRISSKSSDTDFDDVAGLTSAKKDLREVVEYLRNPEKFISLGAVIPKGILLVGPPGTGKTLMARAAAGEADVSFFSISGSEFIEMFVGVGASRVRDLFEKAKKASPSIIFIDELDSIGRARGTGLGGGHDEREQTLNQILAEMDGFVPKQAIVVLAATNRPDVLDPALIRPGRFDRRIVLHLPRKKARVRILEIHSREVPLADDVDLEGIAAMTVGFSGADLENLVNEAALLAGREKKDQVEMEDFNRARDKMLLGPKTDDIITDEEKEVIAYHEAGHAVVAQFLSRADPLQKVTIIPRGKSLGSTQQIPEKDRHNLKKAYLKEKIAVMLGGRAAERMVFGDISNGAANDLRESTRLARRMICLWGMSDKLGPVYFQEGEEHTFLGKEMTRQKRYSEETARIIDEEIAGLIGEMEEKAAGILEENRKKLDKLADRLMEQETVSRDEIDEILGAAGKD